mgnify:CR=1 FL=1
MNKLIRIYFFLIVVVSFTSCKKEKAIESIPLNNISVKETLAEKIKSKPKIFLKYWEGMSVSEFYEVTAILKKEKVVDYDILTETSYVTDLCRIRYKPNFVESRLKSISLVSDIYCIYPLYQKKYNLTNLIEEDIVYESYIDNNKDFEPVMMYKKTGEKEKLTQIPDVLIDKTAPLKRRIYLDENSWRKSMRSKFYKDYFIIDNDSVIIEFKQSLTKEMFPSVIYSLSKNKDAMSAMSNINGVFGAINNPGSGITDEIIMKNSRTVEVVKMYSIEQSITYISKKEYLKTKELQDSKIKKDSLVKETIRNTIKSRKEKAIDEI